MKVFIITLLGLSLLFSCDEKNEEIEVPQETSVDSIAKFGDANFQFPQLATNTSELVTQWPIFEDFHKEATSLNDLTIQELRIKTPRVLAHTDSLTKKIPDSLNTKPINSRLIIVKTRAELLDQILNRSIVDSIQLQMALTEMNMSVRYFLMQLNGKIQKDQIDFQRRDDERKELEKQQRILDSIFQSEIEDNSDN